MKFLELQKIPETPSYFDELEKAIAKLFRDEIYIPLVEELGEGKILLENTKDDLISAIRSGRISFYRGKFTGRFNSTLIRELRNIGAEWDRKHGWFSIPRQKLPDEVKAAIDTSFAKFQQVAIRLDQKLNELVPEKIAEKLNAEAIFDASLWKIDQEVKKTLKGITVAPSLTVEGRQRIAKEYERNMKYYIKKWSEKEIEKLRKDVKERAFDGFRYESMVKKIQQSYGVSQTKAKFLARQETSLLMTKFKEVRYQDAGVNEYKWTCVRGSPAHPVRPFHKKLDGRIFTWDNPPIVNEQGEHKNPGQDYNCRCVAIPIVRFQK